MSPFFARRVSVPDDVLVRELEGESVLLNLKNECYYGLDQVGTRMWQALTTATCIESAFNLLLEEHDVEPDKLRSDLERLLDDLTEHGLVQIHDDSIE